MQKLRYGPEAAYYSHTAIAIWHSNGELFVYEADPEVKKTPFKDWVLDKNIAIGRVPFRQFVTYGTSKDELKTIIKSKLGLRYDYFSLVVFQILLILSGKWYGSKNSNAFYCSEFTSWILYVGTGILDKWYSVNPAKSYRSFKNEDWICYKGKASDLLAQ